MRRAMSHLHATKKKKASDLDGNKNGKRRRCLESRNHRKPAELGTLVIYSGMVAGVIL